MITKISVRKREKLISKKNKERSQHIFESIKKNDNKKGSGIF